MQDHFGDDNMSRHSTNEQNFSRSRAIAAIWSSEGLRRTKLRRFIVVSVLSFFFTVAARSQTLPPSSFVDNFDQPVLNSAWQLHPGADQILLTNPGLRYELGAPQGNSNAADDTNSLWVFRQFSGDSWTLETKVTYSLPLTENGRQMLLRVPFPDTSGRNFNEVRWWRDVDCCGPRNRIVIDFTDNGQLSTGAILSPNAVDTYVIRVIRKQQALEVKVSSDGTTFSSVAQYTYSTPLPSLQDVVLSSANFCCTGYADYDYVLVSGCPVNDTNVRHFAGGGLSLDLRPTSMVAAFSPPDGATLAAYASACGFAGFDWQQTITALPCPNPFLPNDRSIIPQANFCSGQRGLKSPPNISDPPSSGWTYSATQGRPNYNPFPFYYPSSLALSQEQNPNPSSESCIWFLLLRNGPCLLNIVSADGTTLFFRDAPSNPFLSPPRFMAFSTSLVGIYQGGNPSPPLFHWSWTDTFNGTSGGVATTSNDLGVDPGSGSGGITITDINGVPQTPPSVSCMGNPSALWPPNGESIMVTVSGTVTAGTQTIPASGTTFAVTDEYGQDQPTGSIAVGAGGSYSFTVPLTAARDGSDLDGRTYTINVIATDAIGNVGSCAAVVTVPHDQGH